MPTAAALRFWYGIAVPPCFSASGKVPVTRCGLPLRGTYAVYVQFPLRLSHAHARLRPRKHFKRFHQSRQGGRIPTRSFQQALSFSVRRSAYSHIIRELPGLWHGQLGIEPTAHGFGDRVATLVHLPVYPAFAYPPERVRILSNARFNAGKSNGPSRSHALLTGHNARQVWACRNIAPVRCQLWDLVQTAGLEPAHTSGRGALPIELRLRMSPLGHIVERRTKVCIISPSRLSRRRTVGLSSEPRRQQGGQGGGRPLPAASAALATGSVKLQNIFFSPQA